jgi:hypothetical protein
MWCGLRLQDVFSGRAPPFPGWPWRVGSRGGGGGGQRPSRPDHAPWVGTTAAAQPAAGPSRPSPTPVPATQAASDEEALRGEEEEALRLQAARAARLGDDDYGLDADLAPAAATGAADKAAGEGAGAAAGAARPAGGRRGRGVEVEAVAKDLSALTQGAGQAG